MLPGMNGFSLCETIRRTDQKIGIIILSAKGQEQDKIRGLSIGADDYMTKPFSAIISRMLASSSTTSTLTIGNLHTFPSSPSAQEHMKKLIISEHSACIR